MLNEQIYDDETWQSCWYRRPFCRTLLSSCSFIHSFIYLLRITSTNKTVCNAMFFPFCYRNFYLKNPIRSILLRDLSPGSTLPLLIGFAYFFPVFVVLQVLDFLLRTPARSLLQLNAQILTFLWRHDDACRTASKSATGIHIGSSTQTERDRLLSAHFDLCSALFRFTGQRPCYRQIILAAAQGSIQGVLLPKWLHDSKR